MINNADSIEQVRDLELDILNKRSGGNLYNSSDSDGYAYLSKLRLRGEIEIKREQAKQLE